MRTAFAIFGTLMSSRFIRILLVLSAVAAGMASAYFLREVDAALAREQTATGALQGQAQSLLSSLADVRTGQVSYVARGQGEAFWMERVSKLLPVLDRQMAEFKVALTSPAAQADLESAAAAIDNFHKLDARAQEYVKGSDPLLASDLIFSDGQEAMAAASIQVKAALNDELQAREASAADLKMRELTILGGGAGGVLLILMMLGFSGAPKAPEAAKVEPTPSPEPVVLTRVTAADSSSLLTAAQICTELARVTETNQLPALLERLARVLDASGIIVWIADPAGSQLHAAVAFGYSEQVMARFGSIPRDAGNAAAASYRSGEMRTATGDGFANGALVTPLLTADGCIGVLSAEMKGGSEKDEGSRALASIFAAQLATLVSTSSSAALIHAAEA
jgi:CHASE3 domain sensor protein